MFITNTKGYKLNTYNGFIRVECPECGSGGASSYPCTCHICDSKVLMLPVHTDGKPRNWNEVFNKWQ